MANVVFCIIFAQITKYLIDYVYNDQFSLPIKNVHLLYFPFCFLFQLVQNLFQWRAHINYPDTIFLDVGVAAVMLFITKKNDISRSILISTNMNCEITSFCSCPQLIGIWMPTWCNVHFKFNKSEFWWEKLREKIIRKYKNFIGLSKFQRAYDNFNSHELIVRSPAISNVSNGTCRVTLRITFHADCFKSITANALVPHAICFSSARLFATFHSVTLWFVELVGFVQLVWQSFYY